MDFKNVTQLIVVVRGGCLKNTVRSKEHVKIGGIDDKIAILS